jgi:hypothetical protein
LKHKNSKKNHSHKFLVVFIAGIIVILASGFFFFTPRYPVGGVDLGVTYSFGDTIGNSYYNLLSVNSSGGDVTVTFVRYGAPSNSYEIFNWDSANKTVYLEPYWFVVTHYNLAQQTVTMMPVALPSPTPLLDGGGGWPDGEVVANGVNMVYTTNDVVDGSGYHFMAFAPFSGGVGTAAVFMIFGEGAHSIMFDVEGSNKTLSLGGYTYEVTSYDVEHHTITMTYEGYSAP